MIAGKGSFPSGNKQNIFPGSKIINRKVRNEHAMRAKQRPVFRLFALHAKTLCALCGYVWGLPRCSDG